MEHLFYINYNSALRTIITAPIVYFLVIFYIRMIGKRSTSQMNNFDWLVTVAMGSLIASTIIYKDVSIVEGAFAILIFLGLQYFVTKLMITNQWLRFLIKSKPMMLLYDGKFLEENMAKERILPSEIYSAIRENGISSKSQVFSVVLETDAKLSVLPKDKNFDDFSALEGVLGLPKECEKFIAKHRHQHVDNQSTEMNTTNKNETM